MKLIFIIFIFMLKLQGEERIISLSPAITEILFALEKGEAIVGTSAYSLYPQKAQDIPIIGGYENPYLEKILAFSPTLVIGQVHNQTFLNKLKHFKIKTLMLDLKSIKSIQNSIILLAMRLKSKEAKKLTDAIDNSIKKAKNTQKSHSVMIVYGLREDLRSSTYIAGNNIFFNDIIKECGYTNAYTQDSNAQVVLSYENIIAINPQQIIILHSLATESNVDVQKALKNWYKIPTRASKNSKISIVDEDYLHIPSHRISLTIQRLCGEMND